MISIMFAVAVSCKPDRAQIAETRMNLPYLSPFYVALAVFAAPAAAQDHSASPYAGLEKREVKALSDQQIADLRAGRGMGLALAAELNFYPGPSHVLELADALHLSDKQRTQTKNLFDAMKAETMPIGERIIDEETVLDRLFAERRITPELLEAVTSRISVQQGRLRAAHLRYHMIMVEVLSPAQIARYAALRGYSGRDSHRHGAP
jgi:hypothetical protein